MLIGTDLIAQSDTSSGTTAAPDWYKTQLRKSSYIQGRSSSDILNTLQWKWEFIGPAIQPEELNPGGKAIPAYAANRGNGTGRINYIYIHPTKDNQLWACSPSGGIWYSRNGGNSWLLGGTDKLPISGVSSVAVNIAKPKQWVISTGDGDDQFMYTDGIWLTKNAGRTYENINGSDPADALPFQSDKDATYIGEVVCKPDNFNYLIVASSKGLWICENAGEKVKGHFLRRIFGIEKTKQRWKRVAEGQFYDVEIISHPSAGEHIIVASGEKLVVSYDGGISWEKMPQPDYKDSEKYKFLRMSVEYSPALPYFLLVAVTCTERETMSQAGEGSLQSFDLKSKKWTVIRPLKGDVTNLFTTRARAFTISPLEPELVLCGNVQPVYRSVDGGEKFNKVEKNQMHDDIHHLEFAPNGNTVWATHDGGVSVSYDKGLHWQAKDKGIGAANIFGLSTSQTSKKQFAFGAYDTGGNLLRDDKWWHVSWGDGFETVISPDNPDIIFTTMQNGLIQGSITGKNFDEGKSANSKSEWHTWIRMHPDNHNTIYCAGEKVMRSVNLGHRWESIFDCEKQDSTLLSVYRFFLSPDHPSVMYAYALDKTTKVNPQVWVTKNLMEEDATKIVWERLPYLPIEGWIVNISVDANDCNKFWILYNRPEADGKIWYYDGSRFHDRTLNLSGAKCESMIMQKGTEQRIYIGTNYGVFTKAKDDNEWTLLQGLPGTAIKALDINYATGKLVVGTFGRGIWQGDLLKR